MKRLTTIFVVLLGVFVLASVLRGVMAVDTDPAPPLSVNKISDETFNESNYADVTLNAEAGNVSEISIFGVSQTIHWQGFYGNITGTITLEDAQGNVFYNWSSAEPQGEIYAARSTTITWANVGCFADAGVYSYSAEETAVEITADDVDGVNETFALTNHPTFYLGADEVTGCPTVWSYINSAAQQARFAEILLEDDANSVAIYTTIIENRDDGNSTDYVGFDGAPHDFQLMVPENGTNGNTDVTPYYFFVQIE